ncbi:M protein repeat protein [Drechmeria coniospora]|uniref:M protein repeat protein n=1 Tax=Drechmeria coniospora TaxID=98403 RepID=A0A151GBS6_DRECN|nr:M protein repeat protein [Drechmeria coniospora]KYK54562.1 M protein repeat protein [Drechmeria coniospora]
MPAYSPRAQAALLKAVNQVFDLDQTAESLEELRNGIILAHILHELDSEFEPSHLESNPPGTSKYLTNKRNIQTVYKGLFRFIRQRVPELACQARRVDFHAITEIPEAQGISQLLAVMVSAAAMGPDNGKYVPRIQHGLDRDNQAEIMQIIRGMQQDVESYKDADLDEAIDAVTEARDIDLVVEEQNATLRQQLDAAKKALSDYITRLEHLQQSHEELKHEKEKNERELDVFRKATLDGAHSAQAIKLLEAQVQEQMEIISRNEESIRDSDRAKAQLESEVQRLSQKSMQADELRDQATEWKHKAEELEKKANTAERYKQKLEAQQGLVREVQNLQYERTELQEQIRSLKNDRERGDRTRKAEDELTRMITQSEQHLWDERNQKNQLLTDIATLRDELVRLKAQCAHDERFIQDLQDQMQQQGSAVTSPSQYLAASTAFNLEDELKAASSEGQANVPLEMSRLKAENELLRRTFGSSGDTASLRRELEEQRRLEQRLQQNLNIIFEKQTITEEQIKALMENATDERSQAFIKLRSQLAESQSKLEEAAKSSSDLQAKAADMNRDLLRVKAQLSATEKGGLEAIDDLKSTDKLISESLKDELDRLREEHNFVVSERDAQKSQLIEALLAKDKLRREAVDNDTSTIAAADPDAEDAARKSGEKIEKLRARLKERKLQLEQSENDKLDLQHKLKEAQGGEDSAGRKDAAEQMVKNLQRENALIATAWYDLTSRLQSNHVVLQRRQDAPRSWLNKQRQMVNGQLRRRDLLYLY